MFNIDDLIGRLWKVTFFEYTFVNTDQFDMCRFLFCSFRVVSVFGFVYCFVTLKTTFNMFYIDLMNWRHPAAILEIKRWRNNRNAQI